MSDAPILYEVKGSIAQSLEPCLRPHELLQVFVPPLGREKETPTRKLLRTVQRSYRHRV